MRERKFNDIVNDFNENSYKRIFNDNNDNNDNYETMSMNKKVSQEVSRTEYIADKLVKIYNAPESRKFFLKCAWHLSEDTIWSAVEASKKRGVRSPLALFIFICNNALLEAPAGQ